MEITNNKKMNINKRLILQKIYWLLTPILFCVVVDLFFAWMNRSVVFVLMGYKVFLLQCILVFLLEELLVGIVKKRNKAILILGCILYLLSVTNMVKFAFTGDPVLFSDLLFLNNAGEVMGLIEGELWKTLTVLLIPMVGEGIIFAIYIVVGQKVLREEAVMGVKKRCIVILFPLAILIVLVAPLKPINQWVLHNIYETNQRKDYNTFKTMALYYVRNGFVGGIYGQMLEDRIWEPDDYNEELIQKELSAAKGNLDKNFGMPNVIVVFSESFWDIDQLEEVQFNQPVTPNFNRLKSQGLFFNMISPSYGGVSSNVEFEFLTGGNLMYYNYGFIPYMQLYHNDSYYNRPSMIQELKKNGYRTKIVACTTPELFNCGKVYDYFGVDETEFLPENEHTKGKYVSDEYITDTIIKNFEEKKKDEKLFYMTLTMQAHMPYPIDKYKDYDVRVTESDLSESLNDTLTSYAQGIYDADKQLGRIADYIQTLDEPTIVVFYGDHLPYLMTGNENALDQLKYFNTKDEMLNTYRKYNTQALVLANFDLKQKGEEPKYLGPDLLGAYLLNHMNINISDYYKWLYESSKTIGAANYAVAVDEKGTLFSTDKLTGKMKTLYDKRKQIEYKLFVK